MNDFTGHSDSTEKKSNKNTINPNFQFITGRSMYQKEFIKKKPEPSMHFAPYIKSLHPNNLKFNDITTYNSNFVKKNEKNSLQKQIRYKSAPKIKIFSDFKINSESTHMREFKKFNRIHSLNFHNPEENVLLTDLNKMQSTSQREFQGRTSPTKEIHRRISNLNKK